jgi:asparagine synthase (glutamine-hydrolysing)
VLAAVATRLPGRVRFLRARNFRQLSGWLEPIVTMPLQPRPQPLGGLRTQLARDLTDLKMNHWLRAGHQSYMSIPLEMRVPFLDHRVIEWGASLPSELLIRQGWHKWVLRRAMERDLPSEVAWRRRKAGYPFPLKSWLAKHKASLLLLSHTRDGSFLHLKALEERYDLLCREAPDVLWRLLSVALWWKRCVLNGSLNAEPCAA